MFERPTSFVQHPQQVRYASRFLDLLLLPDAGPSSRDMRLSGGRGTGKSATAILAFMAAQAQGHIAAYLHNSANWAYHAMGGRGDVYLLDAVFQQNADLVAADPELAAIFKALRKGDADGEHDWNDMPNRATAAFQALYELQGSWSGKRIGLIVERMHEMQQRADDSAGRYFASGGWLDWSGRNSRLFARLDTARSFGELLPLVALASACGALCVATHVC